MENTTCVTGEMDKLVHLFIKHVCSHDVYICAGLLFGVVALRVWMTKKK